MTADLHCPQCGGLLLSCGHSLYCSASPCDWSQSAAVFAKSLMRTEEKALSASNASAGGALVPPPQQGRLVSPFRNRRLFDVQYSGIRGQKEQGTCHQGERSDLTGCTPASGEVSPREAKQETSPDEQVSKFQSALARIKNKPVLKQINAAKAVMAGVVKKVHAKLAARYGEKTATAVMASGQVLGWTPTVVGALFGQVISIPGATLFGAIPGVCVAEFVKQAKRLAGKDKGLQDDLVAEVLAELEAEYEKYLKGHADEIERALRSEDTPQVPPSPLHYRKSLEFFPIKAGFTGTKKDKLGRNRCYQDGRLVGCARGGSTAARKPAAKKPATKPPAVKPDKSAKERAYRESADRAKNAARHVAKDPSRATAQQVKVIGDALIAMTLAELKEFKKELNIKGGSTKKDIVERIKRDALTKAGIPESDIIEVPDEYFEEKKPEQETTEIPPQSNEALTTGDVFSRMKADAKTQKKIKEFADSVQEPPDYAKVKQIASEQQARMQTVKYGSSEYMALEQQFNETLKKRNQMGDSYRKEMQEKFKSMFGAERPAQVVIDGGSFHEHTKKRINESVAFLHGLVSDKFDNTSVAGVRLPPRSRAYYGNGKVYISDDANTATITHEFGHHLNEDRRVKALCKEFLNKRLGDEKKQKLKDLFPAAGFGDDEMGAKDDFEKLFGKDGASAYYAGKTYFDGQTELISLGVETLYNAPAEFAKSDPEFFHFIVGIVNGTLLGEKEPELPEGVIEMGDWGDE